MFASRAMNKKDMQQFMKDKLAKTKIASESLATAQSIGTNLNNFKKSSQSSSVSQSTAKSTVKRESVSDNQSSTATDDTSVAIEK